MKSEKDIRDKLKNYSVDWDKEELLDSLESALGHPKKDYRWMWLILLALSLIMGLLIWNASQFSEDEYKWNQETEEVEHPTQNTNKSLANPIHLEKDTLIGVDAQNITKTQDQTPSTQYTSEAEIRTDNLDPKQNSRSRDITSFTRVNKPIPESHPSNHKTIAVANDTKQINIFIDKSSHTLNTKENKSHESKTHKVNQKTAVGLQDVTSIFNDISSEIAYLPTSELNLLTIDTDRKHLETMGSSMKTMEESQMDKQEDKALSPWYLSLRSELGFVQRQRTFLTDNPVYEDRLIQNESTERALYAAHTDLCLAYQHSSGWSLESGLAYQEIKELFNYEETWKDTAKSEGNINYIIVDQTDTTFVMDSTMVIDTYQRKVRHNNKHKLYSIPFRLGYEFSFLRAKCRTSIGANYTFAHNFEGKTNHIIEGGSNEVLIYGAENNFSLKDRIGLQASLALSYPLLNKHQWFAEASYRRSAGMAQALLNQRYHSFSAGVGVRIALGQTL